MTDLDRVRVALQDADGLGGVLDASWDAFDVLVSECQYHHDQPPGMLASYAFAGVAAAEGRTIVSAAPSLPATRGVPVLGCGLESWAGSAETAGALPGLAELLHRRLAEAVRFAGDARDQAACAHAALQATLVRTLLTGSS